ncbi:MAG: hypothetical protein AB7L13_22895 [Acidimicrobiia bacterium]
MADRLFDVLVYAPIGAIADAQSHVVQLAERGRGIAENRVRVAKIVGQFAVDRGRKEMTKLLDHPPISQAVPAPASTPVASAVPVRQHDAEASGVLAIADYDALAASQVVSRLEGLTPAERAAIATYETAHRARRTILGKLAQLDEAD